MAVNTEVKTEVNTEVKTEVNTEVKTPTEQIVDVFLPKVPGEAPYQYVGVNGQAWQIPRGKKWQVPKYVAGVLEDCQKAQDAADEYSAEEQKKLKVIQGAPV